MRGAQKAKMCAEFHPRVFLLSFGDLTSKRAYIWREPPCPLLPLPLTVIGLKLGQIGKISANDPSKIAGDHHAEACPSLISPRPKT
jgi:hypothetical protein